MRILITNTGPWGTGSFTVAKAVAEELLALGHEVKIFFPDAGLVTTQYDYYYSHPDLYHIWQFPIKDAKNEIDFFPLMIPDPHPRNPKRNTFSSLTEDELNLYISDFEIEVKKLINEFKPDIVECQHIWVMDHVIEKMNLPYICTAHYSDQMGFRFDPRMRPYAIKSAHDAPFIFAISHFVKEDVISLYNVPREKVVVVNNGYDKSTFERNGVDRAQTLKELNLDIPDDAFIISFAGKVSRTKGVDILLKANKLLGTDSNVHFIICGAGSPCDVLSEGDKEHVLFDRVHFIGHQPPAELAKIHNISKISTMPSRTEGFGIACLEAMGCGLPLIFTRSGGLEEFAVGEMIEMENPKQLADAVIKFKNMGDEEFEALADKAYRIANRFSWRAIAEQRLKYYNIVLGQEDALKAAVE